MMIDLVAKLKKTEDFMKEYQKGDEKKNYNGKSLIFYSLANSDLVSRYAISSILLESGVDVLGKNNEQETVLHVLFGQAKNDTSELCKLYRIFVEKGSKSFPTFCGVSAPQ